MENLGKMVEREKRMGGGEEAETLRCAECLAMKFGGTSMGTAESIKQVAAIVRGGGLGGNWSEEREGGRGASRRLVVVVSASSGTTDALIDLGKKALAGGDWEAVLEGLVEKHGEILEGLGLEEVDEQAKKSVTGDTFGAGKHVGSGTDKNRDIKILEDFLPGEEVGKNGREIGKFGSFVNLSVYWSELRKLAQGISMLGELSLPAMDRLMSFGERISSEILAAYLSLQGGAEGGAKGVTGAGGVGENRKGASWHLAVACNSYNFVFTDNNFGEGNVDFERTNAAIRGQVGGLLKQGFIPVITGFIGQAANGHYITLGRGGSDYTGAIVGAALDAEEVQIWTDVDGIFSTDPRLMPEARVLPQLSFAEAGELAYFGAKVLHPKTIKPAVERDIPVRILNTFNPSAPGTVITNEVRESLKSVTYRKGVNIINICSAGMLEARGFLARLFEVFARHQIAVDVVSTSEVSVSLTVDNGCAEAVLADLRGFASVEVQSGMAIVCLVGEGVRSDTRVLGRLFAAIEDYDVSMVSQGASKRNITFVVKESEVKEVVKRVFEEFFKGLTSRSL